MYSKDKARVVYGLVDPRDSQIYYIGSTTQLKHRITAHFSPKNQNESLREWITELAELGLRPKVRFYGAFANYDEGGKKERYWIRKLYVEGHPLKNRKSIYWKNERLDSQVQLLLNAIAQQ